MNQAVSYHSRLSLFAAWLFLYAGLLIVSGCNDGVREAVPPPDWVSDPQDGAAGSAVTHIRGRHAQEELAITRARERLAARYGVELSSVQTITEKVVNENAYVTSLKTIDQSISKRVVKAHVREIWYDEAQDVVWAWVYPVK